MKYLMVIGVGLLVALTPLFGQFETLYFHEGCNFANEDNGGPKKVFAAHDEAKRIVNEILRVKKISDAGIVIVASGDVKNAFATRDGASGTPYILYNVNFLEKFKGESRTKWAAYSVFAHEIAHHILNHSLDAEDNVLRKQQELAADAWAAQVLARLDVTLDDALAGVRTFDLDGESATHPHPTAREQQIGLAFVQERDKIGQEVVDSTDTNPRGSSRHPIMLDFSRKNRWNLFTEDFLKNAEIDNEKVTIRYQVPAGFTFSPLIICLSANNDAGIIPGGNMPDTAVLRGTGTGVFFDPNHNIVTWSYRREGYTSAVAERAKLQLFIYDLHDPHPPSTSSWVGSTIVTVLGLGSSIYGFTERDKGLQIYKVYEEVLNPMDDVYTLSGESRFERLDRANKHYLRGQYFLYGGMAIVAGGGIWLYDRFRQKKTFNNDVCSQDAGYSWQPILEFNNNGIALGAQLQF